MSDYDYGWSLPKTIAVGVCVVACVAAFVLLLVVLCLRVSQNDARGVARDRAVKIECLTAGGSWIGGNCINLVGAR